MSGVSLIAAASAHDEFRRTVELTDPDGVKFITTYARCGSDCAAVDGVAPAMKVETDSPITPKVTRYLDQLGRVVPVRTESFASAHDIFEDVRHDARGRVLRRSAPYVANATKVPNTTYEYDDDLPRVVKETRPDGGETAYAYAAGTDGATTVTATEKARVMPGDPDHKYPNSRRPYVRWAKHGKALDVDGNILQKGNTPEAHIPLEDFRFNPDLFK